MTPLPTWRRVRFGADTSSTLNWLGGAGERRWPETGELLLVDENGRKMGSVVRHTRGTERSWARTIGMLCDGGYAGAVRGRLTGLIGGVRHVRDWEVSPE